MKNVTGTTRQLRVPDIVYKRAIQILRDADELTITAVVRQERANTGSIVSFSLDSNRYCNKIIVKIMIIVIIINYLKIMIIKIIISAGVELGEGCRRTDLYSSFFSYM